MLATQQSARPHCFALPHIKADIEYSLAFLENMSVVEILPFLKDQKPEVRLQAAQHLAGLSGSTEGREKLLEVDGKILTQALARLIGDLAPVSQQALSTLINLSNETAIVEHMTNSSSLFDKDMENLKSYHEKLGATKAKLQIERSVQETTKIQLRLNLILLSNISQTSSGALCMLQADNQNRDLVGRHFEVDKVVSDIFLKRHSSSTARTLVRIESH